MFDSKFKILLKFLQAHPETLSSRKKTLGIDTEERINALHEHYLNERTKKLELNESNTIPDIAVSIILKQWKNFSDEKLDQIKIEHKLSMSAENKVGQLLERYIAETLEPYGWVWCAGDFVKAIDFIKYNQQTKTWKAVQIKNRKTTENSSSSAIRNGTNIQKWFRTFDKPSRKRSSDDNWDQFPEEEFRGLLSEEGFLTYIRNYWTD